MSKIHFPDTATEKINNILRILIICLVFSYTFSFLWHEGGIIDQFRMSYANTRWLTCVTLLFLLLNLRKIPEAVNIKFLLHSINPWIPIFISIFILAVVHGRDIYPHLGLLRHSLLICIAVSCFLGSRNSISIKQVFLFNAYSCLLTFAVGIYQTTILGFTFPGQSVNQNVFAMMAVTIGIVSLSSYFYREILGRLIVTLCCISGILSLFIANMTGCRTVFVAELIVLIFFLYLLILNKVKLKYIIGVLFIAFALIACAIMSDNSLYRKFGLIASETTGFFALSEHQTTNTSIGLRFAMWKTVIQEVIPNYPFFGIGQAQREDLRSIINLIAVDANFHPFHWHNELINIVAEGGLFGLAMWILSIFLLIKRAKNEPILSLMLVAALSCGITEVFFEWEKCFLVFISIWVTFCAADYVKKSNSESIETRKHARG